MEQPTIPGITDEARDIGVTVSIIQWGRDGGTSLDVLTQAPIGCIVDRHEERFDGVGSALEATADIEGLILDKLALAWRHLRALDDLEAAPRG